MAAVQGVKGHSKVKFRLERRFCPIHITGLNFGIGVSHVIPKNFDVCPKWPIKIQGSKVILLSFSLQRDCVRVFSATIARIFLKFGGWVGTEVQYSTISILSGCGQ